MSTAEEVLKKLRLARAQQKGTVTRIENFISDPINLASASIEMIQARIEKLNTTFRDYERTQLDILSCDDNDKENVAVLENKYFDVISKLNSALKNLSTSETKQCSNVSTSKLPNIDIPIFDGKDFTKYTPFIDLFMAVIDGNRALSDVQKLFYLRKFLSEEALAVVVNLPLENKSYKEAIELLKKRFENKSRLIFNHINILLQLPVMQKSTAASIRSFTSQVQQQLYALKNLQQPVNQWDMLLISILSKKLDLYTNRAYQLDRDTDTLPTMEGFISFLEKRAIAFEDSCSSDNKKNTVQKVSNVVTKTSSSCSFCGGMAHLLHSCPKFKMASIEDRIKFIDDKMLCTMCLKTHTGKCKFSFSCKICKQGHNTLLHKDSDPGPQASISLHSVNSTMNTLLPTIKVKLIDYKGSELYVRALLDSGSQVSLITTHLVEKLQVKPKKQNTNIIGIGNNCNQINKYVDITINSPVKNVQLNIKCHVVNYITANLPQNHFDSSKLNIPKHIQLSDDEFNVPTEISMLLGADIYFNILIDGQLKIHNGLLLQNTLFGYTIGGKQFVDDHKNSLVTNLAICDSDKLELVMEQFWLTEMIPQSTTKGCNELKKSEKCFQQSVKLENDKFCVDMPLASKMEELQLGDSFSVALQRFITLEKRFKQNPVYLEKYKSFIEEYIALGHAKTVDVGSYDVQNGTVYFLAHHAVLNEASLTTKLRVVFDGSMKSRAGVSLNDVMLNGPVVQSELFDILLRWRTYLYTLTCDIQKMFRGILINPSQTCLQNILWRDAPCKPISCLQLQTVTYGLKSSTFLATRCLIELAHRYQSEFPLAAQAMLLNTYCDDVICGSDSTHDLYQLKHELIALLKKGSFTLHKWCSNYPEVINDLPNEHKCFEKLDINKNNIVKTLGLKCDILNDTFTFTCPMINNDDNKTKRSILSFIGKMFDPLGLIGPIIVVAKIFMQTLWAMNLDWDKILPQEQLNVWDKFIKNLALMNTITVPRYVSSCDVDIIELVGYADASMKAFGSCLYLRTVKSDGSVFVHLLCSKSRVAPLKKNLTIPRLELNSALLLSQIGNRVYNILKCRFPSLTVHFYSDSQIALAWIKSKNIKSNPYVANRVKQIKILTSHFQWSYVSTDNNPADLLSRGCDPYKLKSSVLWWHGPKELLNKDFKHSVSKVEFPIPYVVETDIVNNMCEVNEPSSKKDESLLSDLIGKISDFNKLQRIVAYILRFRQNCSKNIAKMYGPLTVQELRDALLAVIRSVQRKHFPKEIEGLKNNVPIKSGLSGLHPFLDQAGVLRVGGRLQCAKDMAYNKKHPAILPKSCNFTDILIRKEHLRLLHAGARLVLSSLSQQFWLISGIREVKKVVNKCVKCFRLKAAAAKQLMGSLPQDRITAVRPFNVVGVDFCGPFNVKASRIRKPLITKGYVALFVCFATKAIHMELVSDLTTEAFLACLKRFISRRGMPEKIFCDNAKTFKGAANELNKLYKLFISKTHKDSVNNYCTPNFIKFKFIPSYSPEFGGLWEAGVKSFKHHFKRIVGTLVLTFEGLYTAITEIEAVLNSRPLLPMSTDISDFKYLTPGHFLIGTSMMSYPEADLSNYSINNLRFWNVLCKIKQDFWKVWSGDYLTQLQSRPKWHHINPNLKEGDLVILRSDNTAPMTWPMARIVKTTPGPDGIVRVAEIKLPNNKTYVRSLRKLCPLPIN